MLENKKLNSDDMDKVSGGAMVNGQNMTFLERDEIKKYEYRCKSCGAVEYRDSDSIFCSCPKCGKFFGYSATGVVLVDYGYADSADKRSCWGQDT